MSTASSPGWREFWQADCLASCVPDNPATAEQIAADWRARLAGLADGSRILDVATGNGVVLTWAAEAARTARKRFVLTGVDLADIDPPRYVRALDPDLRNTRFLGGVAAEALPFPDASFDAVVSQYGLEYAALERALAEVARVTASGGQLLWLAHSEDSEIVRQHRRQGAEIDFLLAASSPLADIGNRPALQARLSEAEAYCRAHPPASIVHEVCAGLVARMNAGAAPDELTRIVAVARERLAAHRDRIRTLLAAALTSARLARVSTALAESAWTGLEISELRVGTAATPIGFRISARRCA